MTRAIRRSALRLVILSLLTLYFGAAPTSAGATQASLQQATPASGRVSGRVEDAAGRPLAAQVVRLASRERNVTLTVSSDADGRFAFTNVSLGAWEVEGLFGPRRVALAVTLSADTPEARDVIVRAPRREFDGVPLNDGIRVTTRDGATLNGRARAIDANTVRLHVGDADVEVPLDDIQRVETSDGLADGALIGLAAGFGTGAMLALLGGPGDGCCSGSEVMLFGALVGAGGAGVGAAIDALTGGGKVVYEATPRGRVTVRPMIGASTRGLVVSLRW